MYYGERLNSITHLSRTPVTAFQGRTTEECSPVSVRPSSEIWSRCCRVEINGIKYTDMKIAATSIEDGMNGLDEMAESLAFLRRMTAKYFPE